jgi:dihydrofolate reductase
MTTRCSVFVATSLDGFIAREDGGIDWLDEANRRVPAGEDCGYAEFIASVDALVMGSHTFEMARSFRKWPYGEKPAVVLSKRLKSLPRGTPETVSLSKEAPGALVAQLGAKGMQHLYIDGGITIQRFLAQSLIDEITITRIPVLLGGGKPLFGPLSLGVQLEHIVTRAYDFGFVQSRYRVVRRRT